MNTVCEITRALEEIEVAVERVNDALANSEEFRALQKNVTWRPGPRNSVSREQMEQFADIFRSYQAIWASMSASPLAPIALTPVTIVTHSENN